MSSDEQVRDHYALGGLRARIAAALESVDGPITTKTLGALDEFHIGGRPATVRLVEALAVESDLAIVDLGSGVGGPARFMAESSGARVMGIDLTDEFVSVAGWLTEMVGLSDRASFQVGSATALPFGSDAFDVATMLHVGMNIADKAGLCAGVADALRPGGRFGIYDVMAGPNVGASDFAYPVPWASDDSASFVESAEVYVDCLESAGFTVDSVTDNTESALAFFASAGGPPPGGPPPLGLHLVMGPETPTKVANMAANLRAGCIAPTQIIATLAP